MTSNGTAGPGEPAITRWLLVGVSMVAFYGLIAHMGQDSSWAGLAIGGLGALLLLATYQLWRRSAANHAVPEAEYLALVWLILYATLFVIDGDAASGDDLINWLVVLPPLSTLPIAARWLLDDNGSPRGLARSAAYYLHQIVGILLMGLGLVFIAGGFLILAAPLPLVPGIMHLRAAHIYRRARTPRVESDPRRGFMGG